MAVPKVIADTIDAAAAPVIADVTVTPHTTRAPSSPDGATSLSTHATHGGNTWPADTCWYDGAAAPVIAGGTVTPDGNPAVATPLSTHATDGGNTWPADTWTDSGGWYDGAATPVIAGGTSIPDGTRAPSTPDVATPLNDAGSTWSAHTWADDRGGWDADAKRRSSELSGGFDIDANGWDDDAKWSGSEWSGGRDIDAKGWDVDAKWNCSELNGGRAIDAQGWDDDAKCSSEVSGGRDIDAKCNGSGDDVKIDAWHGDSKWYDHANDVERDAWQWQGNDDAVEAGGWHGHAEWKGNAEERDAEGDCWWSSDDKADGRGCNADWWSSVDKAEDHKEWISDSKADWWSDVTAAPPALGSVQAREVPEWLFEFPESDRASLMFFFQENRRHYGSDAYVKAVAAVQGFWGASDTQIEELETYLEMSSSHPVPEEFGSNIPVSVGRPTQLMHGNAAVEAGRLLQQAGLDAKPEAGKSQSHGAKYMRFLRGGRNIKRLVGKTCIAKFNGSEKDRLELFQSWTDASEDWGNCELLEEKFIEKSKETETAYQWCNTYDMLALYRDDEEMVKKVKDLTKKLTDCYRKGSMDKEEKLDEYYIRVSTKMLEVEKEGTRGILKLTADVDKDAATSLMTDTGRFNGTHLKASGGSAPAAEVEPPTGTKRPKKEVDLENPAQAKVQKKEGGPEALLPEAMKDAVCEATEFANQLCALLGKGTSALTKLSALGMGSDVATKITSSMQSLELHYKQIKKLTQEEETNKYKYKRDMDWAKHYFKLLRNNIKIATAMISASEPKRAKKVGEDSANKKAKTAADAIA